MGVRMRNRLLPRWDIKALVKALGAQERVLLFCVGSRTDRKEAGVTLKTVASLVVNFLVTPFPTGRLALTDADLAALRELVARAMRRRDGGWRRRDGGWNSRSDNRKFPFALNREDTGSFVGMSLETVSNNSPLPS
jgi:hypothetical protein